MARAIQNRSRGVTVELPAERFADLGGDARDVVVRPDVALRHERRVHALRELAHALLDSLPLIRERKRRSAGRESARDRPRDRAFVGDAEDEPALAFESRHGGRVYGFSATLRALRRLVLVPLVAALVLASTTSAALQPVRRSFGERTVPRVQSGALKFTHAHARGRVTVIVGLRSEPLAAYNRNLFSVTRRAKLDVR